MKNNITVESLRVARNKIRIGHKRYITINNIERLEFKKKFDKLGEFTNPRGGQTFIDWTTNDRKTYSIVVKCHARDPYNKKIGVKIGLGRILKQIEEENVKLINS
jgi:hypothetical protein